VEKPPRMDIAELKRHLATKVIGRRIEYHDRIPSTTAAGKALCTTSTVQELHGTVILAEEQTGGTGRLGRAWVSPAGGIWLTLILAPKIPVDRIFMVTMAGSLAVARAIRKEFDLGALIKWPNDILIGDRKVGGLLLEVSSTESRVNSCFLGIGIDVNIPLTALSPELRRTVTSISAELGREVAREPFLAAVLWELEIRLNLLEGGEFDSIVREWRSLSSTLGHRVRIATLSRSFDGEAVDIDEYGALIVRKDSGAVERVIAGDCIHL